MVLPFWLVNAERLRIAVYIVLFLVAAIAMQSHFKTLNEQFDRTAEAASKPIFADRGKAMEHARERAAEATADLNAWEKSLTNSNAKP